MKLSFIAKEKKRTSTVTNLELMMKIIKLNARFKTKAVLKIAYLQLIMQQIMTHQKSLVKLNKRFRNSINLFQKSG